MSDDFWGAAFSSATDEWATPGWLFREMEHEFGPFELDVCATPENAKCPRYFTRAQDGLRQAWAGHVWMNPPYGDEIGRWMAKALEESRLGATVVCLVPARTDTAWWHDYAMRGEVRFLRGRVKFGDAKNSAPFPSGVSASEGRVKRTPMPKRRVPLTRGAPLRKRNPKTGGKRFYKIRKRPVQATSCSASR